MTTQATPIIHSDPKIMGGTPVFVGTRVPFQTLIDYIEGGDTIDEFLDDFPTMAREQVIAAIEKWQRSRFWRASHKCVFCSTSASSVNSLVRFSVTT
ncbi:MAG: DUF433 domain-containing protein [Tepidisphaeraceae bacterium]